MALSALVQRLWFSSVSGFNIVPLYRSTLLEIRSTDEGCKQDKISISRKASIRQMVANEIGRTENAVSRWCSNKVQPSLENLLEIAETLRVDVRE